MKAKWLVMLAAILGLTGCTTVRHLNDITRISYTSAAGSIPRELRWREEIIITQEGVTFIRKGYTPDTEINEGTWEVPVDTEQITALFEQLEAIDLTSIERVEPDSPLDGGDTIYYTISYGREKGYSLVYDPGVTYTNGELITQPVDALIQNLDFSEQAIFQMK